MFYLTIEFSHKNVRVENTRKGDRIIGKKKIKKTKNG